MISTSFLQILLIVVNGVALITFGVDKLQSKKRGWRIPESRLLLIAFFGPFGAYAGMLLFKHKTRKIKFLLVPIFLLIHMILIAYFYFIKWRLISWRNLSHWNRCTLPVKAVLYFIVYSGKRELDIEGYVSGYSECQRHCPWYDRRIHYSLSAEAWLNIRCFRSPHSDEKNAQYQRNSTAYGVNPQYLNSD